MNPPVQAIPGTAASGRADAGFQTVWRRLRTSRRLEARDGGHDLRFQALGSPCRVWLAASNAIATTVAEALVRWVAEFEARYSRFIKGRVASIGDDAGCGWVHRDRRGQAEEKFPGLDHAMSHGRRHN